MASPSHRSAVSISTNSLAPPSSSSSSQRPRRMTSPSLPPPPTALDLPEPVYGHRRPPSPLRNGVTMDPATGELSHSEDGSINEDEEDEQWGQRPSSPSPSVAKFAANFAQRVGSLVSNMSARSPNYLPTDEELEAEAEREREKSRREAERILSREADSKRLEERVLAMIETNQSRTSLPPPPSLSQMTPGTPPSPSGSQKDSWWALARGKLTPTKEPLTPAQQIIQDTKAREKELEKERKEIEKERKEIEKEMKKSAKKNEKHRSKEWPSSPENKYQDPALANLGPPRTHPSRQMSSSPTSSGITHTVMPASLLGSPMRTGEASSSKQQPPLYAQFNAQGTLDIPGTLLTIAQRFEKLERWTVGHVRALEERMDDVERWLVEKEQAGNKQHNEDEPSSDALNEVREELAEVQGRIGELGREMAKMITAPSNLSSGPSRSSASFGRAPSTSSSIAVRSISGPTATTRTSTPPKKEPTSPPATTPVPSSNSRTRLPYPTGDYATPPDSAILNQGPFSPTNSPPSSLNKTRALSISGLPSHGLESPSSGLGSSGLPLTSELSRVASPPTLPTPISATTRPASISPTPRKRYTVALGGSIMGTSNRDQDRSTAPHARTQSRELGTAFFSTSPMSTSQSDGAISEDSDTYSGLNEETIGKSAARHSGLAAPIATNGRSTSTSPTPSSPPQRRPRPQSMYSGGLSVQNIVSPIPTTPLGTRLRSQSTDRFGLSGEKFVDPLIVRKQTKDAIASIVPPPPKVMAGKPKVPVNQLVAFFDQEK